MQKRVGRVDPGRPGSDPRVGTTGPKACFADVDSELPAACHCYAPRAPQPVGTAMRLRVKFEQPLLSSATRNAGKQLLLRRKLSLF